MKTHYLIILIVYLCSCSFASNKSKNQDKSSQKSYKHNFDQTLLIGVWAISEEENALFKLTKDSLYYVDHIGDGYRYNLSGDSLIFYLDEYNHVSKILNVHV